MIFVGNGALLWRAVHFAVTAGHRVDHVFTNDQSTPADSDLRALPRTHTRDINSENAVIADHCGDGVVWSINNPMIFRAPVLGSGVRVYNIHNGLLPGYRGRPSIATVFALLHGITEYGATLHEVDAGVDTGPVLDVRTYPVAPADRYHQVMIRGVRACHALFEANLDRVVAGTMRPIEVDRSRSGYYGVRQLRDLGSFVEHPNFPRATDLGPFAEYFPDVTSALAASALRSD